MEIKNPQGGKTPWHPAFLQAIQQELFDYRDSLDFKYEYQLTTEPLRIDVVIIKKPKDLTINKNIARIFRADNLLEYKSPDDYLSVNDYLKVNAYANLYAAITPGVDFADLSLTFIENRHPRKLLRYLTEIRGYTVEETSPGIFLVSGDYLPIQIIETGKLPERENLWLRSLAKDLQASDAGSILDEGRKLKGKAQLDVYFYILGRANPRAFLEAETMARKKEETFEEVLMEGRLIPDWLERAKEQGLEQGLEQGREQGLEQGLEQGREQGLEQGREQGLEQGREQGLEQGLEIAARNALAQGASLDFIKKITGLDLETINQLASSN